MRAKRNRPIWNFNFTGAQKLPRFDDRDTALGKPNKIEEHLVGFERQWDHFLGWLNMVGKPNRRSYAGGCLLPGFLRQDRSAIAVLSEHYAARQARHTRADNCDVSLHSQMVGTDRRAVPKILCYVSLTYCGTWQGASFRARRDKGGQSSARR